MLKIFLLAILFGFSGIAAETNTFGGKITLPSVSSLDDVLDQYENYQDQEVVVVGQVDKVCQTKGCWLTLKSGKTEDMRVVFKDYGFTVPKDLSGRSVKLQGKVVRKLISVREQKHYLKDEKAPPSKINAVRKPKATFRFIASAVELEKQ
ncbi:MAG: DUF4920 domain-containing protein [Bdellovibrionales bacterium]